MDKKITKRKLFKGKLLKRKIEKRDVISIAVVALFFGIMVFLTLQYIDTFGGFEGGIEVASENMKTMIQSYGNAGIIVFILLHALQVVVAAIPAPVVQFVGGLVYGTFWSVVMSSIGVLLGSLISFNMSRIFGKRIVSLFVSEKTLQKIEGKISGKTSSLLLFAAFVMPGFPNDLLPWVFGLTNFSVVKFHILSTIGRLPGMIVSTYMGDTISNGDMTMVIVFTVVCTSIIVLLYLFRNKLFNLLGKKSKKKEE